MQRSVLSRGTAAPGPRAPRSRLRFSLALGAAAAIAAVVLVCQPLPAAAGSSTEPDSPAPKASSASAALALPWPQGTWSGIRDTPGATPTRVTLMLQGNKDAEMRLEQLRCGVGLKPFNVTAAQVVYVIGPLKGGSPGMAPACDGLWNDRLVLTPGSEKNSFLAQVLRKGSGETRLEVAVTSVETAP